MNTLDVSIGLTNPKSPANVGAILRAAGCYQAGQIFYSGSRYDNAAKFHTDTKNASLDIPLQQTPCLLQAKPAGAKLVCVDLVEGAQPLPEFEHPQQAYYVFGPEDGTIDQAIIDAADAVVYVPTKGCMNLAASVNVILYDRLAKNASRNQGDELIRRSRDVNNKVKVR
ncbi:RNA methyltransferase [Thalassotalea mangrovi]|uniref:RNA methyltransferase n=1 Tax=Thalassotalea mangrovi TaxID=2572245 RepID=A0A4V5NWU6_9GAMM|nr:RNA methyltransferase [Thalassotalea mangrovi]